MLTKQTSTYSIQTRSVSLENWAHQHVNSNKLVPVRYVLNSFRGHVSYLLKIVQIMAPPSSRRLNLTALFQTFGQIERLVMKLAIRVWH